MRIRSTATLRKFLQTQPDVHVVQDAHTAHGAVTVDSPVRAIIFNPIALEFLTHYQEVAVTLPPTDARTWREAGRCLVVTDRVARWTDYQGVLPTLRELGEATLLL